MSCVADWSKCRHVIFTIIVRHFQPRVHHGLDVGLTNVHHLYNASCGGIAHRPVDLNTSIHVGLVYSLMQVYNNKNPWEFFPCE